GSWTYGVRIARGADPTRFPQPAQSCRTRVWRTELVGHLARRRLSHVELLEREAALSTLADAREAAARGEGRVVFVTGEPGIGKTTLVNRFLRDLDETARVLVGTCDDLAVPRPLGPFRDLAGAVSPPLREALAAGAAPHD